MVVIPKLQISQASFYVPRTSKWQNGGLSRAIRCDRVSASAQSIGIQHLLLRTKLSLVQRLHQQRDQRFSMDFSDISNLSSAQKTREIVRIVVQRRLDSGSILSIFLRWLQAHFSIEIKWNFHRWVSRSFANECWVICIILFNTYIYEVCQAVENGWLMILDFGSFTSCLLVWFMNSSCFSKSWCLHIRLFSWVVNTEPDQALLLSLSLSPYIYVGR